MSQTKQSAHVNPFVRLAGAAALAALTAAAPAASAVAAEQLSYKISHGVFGEIGTYSNTVQPSGDTTTVQTHSNIHVKVMGVDMYREEAQRTEQWQGNRLVSFHGVTHKGNGTTEIKGTAHGNSFVINTPEGTITAPATVHPANPWSANFIGSNTMMRPDNGKLEQVSVSSAGQSPVTLNNATIPARRYDVNGKTRYSVWLDARGIPLKFVVQEETGTVTFTLTHCTNCGVDIADATGAKGMTAQR